MDFSFTEEQETVGKVARQLFEHRATPEHLTELESGEDRFDAALWSELASSDLLGIALPESVGGSGGGFLELGVLLAEVGRSVAPVPLYATLVLGADTIARHGDSALQREVSPRGGGRQHDPDRRALPSRAIPTRPRRTPLRVATGTSGGSTAPRSWYPPRNWPTPSSSPLSTDDGPALFVVDTDADGVDVTPVRTTNGEPHADVALAGAVGQRLGSDIGAEPVQSLYTRALVGLCAIQVGVAERALRIAASYTSEREQFGRPIGSFQAVQQRMADAFIDVEAIRWTTWHAAWLVAEGRPATVRPPSPSSGPQKPAPG